VKLSDRKGKRGNEQRTVRTVYITCFIASTFKCFLIHFAFFHSTDGHHDTTYIYHTFYQLIGPTKFYHNSSETCPVTGNNIFPHYLSVVYVQQYHIRVYGIYITLSMGSID